MSAADCLEGQMEPLWEGLECQMKDIICSFFLGLLYGCQALSLTKEQPTENGTDAEIISMEMK